MNLFQRAPKIEFKTVLLTTEKSVRHTFEQFYEHAVLFSFFGFFFRLISSPVLVIFNVLSLLEMKIQR